MRIFLDDLGIVCRTCYFKRQSCSCPGCDSPRLYKSQYCRDHWLDEKIDPRTFMLHKVIGSTSVSAAYPEGDADTKFGNLKFKKQLCKAMEKRGIVWRRDIGWITD